MEKVRLGIVGVGNMGSGHLNNYVKGLMPEIEVTAVADIRPDRLERAKEICPSVTCFNTATELFNSGLCDAAIIATPHYAHPSLCKEAMQAGLHVMSEKPAGVYTKQVRELIEFTKTSDKTYAIMFNQRTNCVYRKVKELVSSGEYGEMRRVNWIITSWFRTQSYYDSGDWRATWAGEGGGVMLNQCPHQLDMWQWICGMPCKIKAVCREGQWHDIEVEDDVTIYAEYPNGASGTFITTFTVKPNDLSDNRATIPALEYIYAGSPVKPKPTLKVSGIKLTRNSDYYVTYSNNDAVGTATVTLTGLGNFSGTTSRTYSIVKAAAGTSTVNGTTYYTDSKGNVERSVTDGVISYSDKYLNKYAKKQITAGGYAISTALPRVDIDTISRGASSRKINITWKHFMDDRYSSYLLLRGDTEGKKWTVLGEIPASDSDKDYKYTDNIKSENSRFFRYALAGVSVRDGKKYAGQLTFDVGWAKVKLCLDPGHYIGCNANSEYSEGTQMLLLGGKLKDSLTSTKLLGTAFATVKITRTGDGVTETFAAGVPNEKFIGYGDGYGEALMARGKYSKGCDYFISLHTNATSTNSWYTSGFWEVQCYINNVGNANSFDWQMSYELGKAASKTIAPGGKTVESRAAFKDRNVINRHVSANGDTYRLGDTYYAVTRAADRVGVPGVLIEHSFHTNPEVRKWMLSDKNLAKLAKAESNAILRQYGFPIEK